MPQLTDLFIAKNDKEAWSYDSYSVHNQRALNGFTDDELIILWACLEKKPLKQHYELIFIEIESDEVLYKLPALLVKLIANIEENNLMNIVISWAEHEEIQCSYDKAKEKLQHLILLAQQAQQQKHSLYLLMN